jgi:hypothetical protein
MRILASYYIGKFSLILWDEHSAILYLSCIDLCLKIRVDEWNFRSLHFDTHILQNIGTMIVDNRDDNNAINGVEWYKTVKRYIKYVRSRDFYFVSCLLILL